MNPQPLTQTSPTTFKRIGKICANNHDRVLFNSGGQCPVCAALDELEAARIDISHLEIQVYELEGKVNDE